MLLLFPHPVLLLLCDSLKPKPGNLGVKLRSQSCISTLGEANFSQKCSQPDKPDKLHTWILVLVWLWFKSAINSHLQKMVLNNVCRAGNGMFWSGNPDGISRREVNYRNQMMVNTMFTAVGKAQALEQKNPHFLLIWLVGCGAGKSF